LHASIAVVDQVGIGVARTIVERLFQRIERQIAAQRGRSITITGMTGPTRISSSGVTTIRR